MSVRVNFNMKYIPKEIRELEIEMASWVENERI